MSLAPFFAMHSRLFAFRRFVYWTLVMLWVTTVFTSPFVRAQETQEDLLAAKPFVSTYLEGLAVTTGKDSTPYAVSMQQGINAPLQIVNLKTMQRVSSAEQRHDGKVSAGRAYLTLPNRHVLVATTRGFLYDTDPDTLKATEQDPQTTTAITFQQAVMGDSQTVYLTATSAREQILFEYNYQTTVWRNLGTVPDASSGLGFAGKQVYLGNSTSTTLTIYNADSKKQGALVLENIPAETTGLQVLGAHGGYLYVNTLGKSAFTLVYDLQAGKIVDQKPAFSGLHTSYIDPKPKEKPTVNTPAPTSLPTAPIQTQTPTPAGEGEASGTPTTSESAQQPGSRGRTTPPADSSQTSTEKPKPQTTPDPVTTPTQTALESTVQQEAIKQPEDSPVYFGALNRYSPLEKTVASLAKATDMRPAIGSCWLDAFRCVVYSTDGKLGILQGGGRALKLASPSPITGGFQTPQAIVASGTSVFAAGEGLKSPVLHADLVRKARSKMVAPPSGGVVSFAAIGSSVFAGTASGEISRYDTTAQTTTPRFDNPVRVGDGRVAAMVENGQEVVFALNQNTKESGFIGVYSPEKSTAKIFELPVLQGQTISSLTAKGNIVYGGGSGQNATLFAYDMTRQTVVTRSVPVLGAKSISSVVLGGDGYLYGVADETLFQVDTRTLSVVRTKVFQTLGQPGSVVFSKDKLLASIGGKIYDVRFDDLSARQIASGTHLALTPRGDYIYSREGALYRMAAETDETVAGATTTSTGGIHLADVQLQLGAGSVAILILLLAVPIVRLFTHRPTYSIRR